MFRHRRKLSKRAILAFIALLATAPAYAQGWHGRGGWHGGGHGWYRGGGWGVPAIIGGAIIYDLSDPFPVYSQPYPVYIPPPVYTQPPVYVQTAPAYAPSAPLQAPMWYFCTSSNAYYPYVTSCPSGWQPVPATPPR